MAGSAGGGDIKARLEFEKMFRLMADNIGDVVWMLDENIEFVFISPAVETVFGFSIDEIMRMQLHEYIAPESLGDVMRVIEDSRESEEKIQQKAFEIKQLKKDGSKVWVHINATMIKNDAGEMYRIVGITRDIDEHKKLQEALAESEEKYRAVVENASDAIFVADPDTGILLNVNRKAEELTGRTKSELVGMHQSELHPPEKVEKYKTKFISATEEEGKEFFEVEVVHRDGTRIPVEISSGGTFDTGKQRIHIGLFRDISERKKAEENHNRLQKQLLQSQKTEAIGQLAGGVAHEINNMLGVIIGYTQLAAQDVGNDEIFDSNLKYVLKAARRSKEITSKLLAFARNEEPRKQITAASDILADLEPLVKHSFPKKIEIRTGVEADVAIHADKTQLHQALLNICNNARDAMPDGGSLDITVSTETLSGVFCENCGAEMSGDYCVIKVKDTGCGIHDDDRDRIFEPFYTTKEVGKGTGLGLSVTLGIVHNHEGHIRLETSPGKGTSVILYFKAEMMCGEKESVAQKPARGSYGDECIMIVDDEPEMLSVLATMLEKAGFKTLPASSAGEAIDIYKQKSDSIDLVLLDMIMPEKDGGELYNDLRKIRQDVKAVVSSGYSDEAETETLLEQGVLDFIQKPFFPDQLFTTIRKAIDM